MKIKFSHLFFLVISVCAFLFTSCVDYVQTISYKNGKYELYYKITLSKTIFALTEENPNDFLDEMNFKDLENSIPNAKIMPVDTDLELGAQIALSISPKNASSEEKEFLPTVLKNQIFIPFLLGSESVNFADSFDENDEYTNIAMAILSSAKCRIMLDKNIASNIQSAYFKGRGGQSYSIPIFDYGSSFCLEIPFIVLFQKTYDFKNIVVDIN